MLNARFENDVKTYGTQAFSTYIVNISLFENDVKTYGTQAYFFISDTNTPFENDVKTYGTQIQKESKRLYPETGTRKGLRVLLIENYEK